MRERIDGFLREGRIAVVGASSRSAPGAGQKFGNYAAAELRRRGFDVRLVHPTASSIDGLACVPSLAELDGAVHALWLCVPPDRGLAALGEAREAGIERVWIQQGGESAALLDLAEAQGLAPVWGRCILMYAKPVGSFHAVHRFFARIFGGLYAMPRRPRPALPPARHEG